MKKAIRTSHLVFLLVFLNSNQNSFLLFKITLSVYHLLLIYLVKLNLTIRDNLLIKA